MQTTNLYIDGALVAPQAGGNLKAINPGPWSGYKYSGIGRELGTAGFMGFRETKQISRDEHTRARRWALKP